jgi:glycosyltransferase involved in cell wall biosynthesis
MRSAGSRPGWHARAIFSQACILRHPLAKGHRVKIAYVITRADSVGGATIHVRDMARAMRERGHEATVFVGGHGPVTGQFAAAGVTFHELRHLRRPIDPFRDWMALNELTKELRTFAPDLVSTHTAKAGWIGRAAAHRLKLPVLYTPHGLPIGGRFLARGRGALHVRRARRAAVDHRRHMRPASPSAAWRWRNASPSRISSTLVHNGVLDIAPALQAQPDRAPVRICSVARLERPKDHATLLAAMATLTGTPWTLDLVGDGPLESRVARAGRDTRHRRIAYGSSATCRTPAATLAAAHLFVLASWSEAFPRSILEAMRAGLPIVTSDVGGVGEAVTQRGNGLRVPPGVRTGTGHRNRPSCCWCRSCAANSAIARARRSKTASAWSAPWKRLWRCYRAIMSK